MFCNKCGAVIDDKAKFCNHCGAAVNEEKEAKREERKQVVSIVFRRDGGLAAALVPAKVFIDNNLVGSLGVGEEMTVSSTIGKHRIDFNIMGGNGGGEVEVSPEHPNIKVVFKVSMGMITAKPKIISIQNLD